MEFKLKCNLVCTKIKIKLELGKKVKTGCFLSSEWVKLCKESESENGQFQRQSKLAMEWIGGLIGGDRR